MLKGLANKDKAKKQAKKDTKNKKQVKEQKNTAQELDQDEGVDLVDMSELKQEQTKVKQNIRKKNDYQLQQKQIDVSNLNLATAKPQKPKMTTWVANSVDQVMKKDFKMDKVEHEFLSLTDQSLNEKLLEKHKEQQEKQKASNITQENNLKLQTIQKSKDQQKMDQVDAQFSIKSSTSAGIGISTSGAPINFTNTSFANSSTFKPIQKTAQEIKMEEMQRKEQQIALKKPTTSWIGAAKKAETQQKPVFKQSAWAATVVQSSDQIPNNVKFAPLNVNETEKQPTKQAPKQSSWATSNIQQSNGLKFAPIQLSKQQEKLKQAERKQQQFVFVSNKQKEQRKKKREQKQKLQNAKVQPKV